MADIQIVTMKDGVVVMNKHAKSGVTVDQICEIAECEVYDGYADYSQVTVDGEIYAEYES